MVAESGAIMTNCGFAAQSVPLTAPAINMTNINADLTFFVKVINIVLFESGQHSVR